MTKETKHGEEAEKAEVLKRKLTNREIILAALSEPESGAFLLDQSYIVDAVRHNDKRPAMVRWVAPDDWVKNLAGYDPLRDYYFALRVPREFVELKEEGGTDGTTH